MYLMNTLAEYMRRSCIEDVFRLGSFKLAWGIWHDKIRSVVRDFEDPIQVINLGDHLREVFYSTKKSGRGQGTLSSAGSAWECLVCWYMNLCLIGSNAVILRPLKRFIPDPVSQAITVNYGSFKSNSESDLIALIFPSGFEVPEDVDIGDKTRVDDLIGMEFSEFGVGVIQCKTNWNDSSQIPMLWDMVYSSKGSKERGISVGTSLYSINDIAQFFYAFVTVPTTQGPHKPESTHVLRVRSISGGNYWGLPDKQSVANSLKEIFRRNFVTAYERPQREILRENLVNINSDFSYFSI